MKATRKPGRPTSNPARDVINLRVSKKDKRLFVAAARLDGETLSRWLVKCGKSQLHNFNLK